MINFIVCDDDKKYLNLVENVITNCMMQNDIEYKLHTFDDYDEDFIKIVEKKLPSKIYILDIEAPTRSGIDIARLIRYKDVNSVLIFITGHQELGSIVMKNDFLFLSFINKFDNCEKRLKTNINKALKILGERKTIRFKDGGNIYNLNLDDILYIAKDSIDRKCTIKTDYNTFIVNKSLLELKEMLTDNFEQTHRACIINMKRYSCYNKQKRLIIFDNGETIDLVSKKYEKVLM